MFVAQPPDTQRTAPLYNIKAVSHLTGVPADTLRRWESRYGVVAPQRTDGGYRLYSQRDVDTIHWLKAKLQEGLSISRACDMLRQIGGDPGRYTPQATAQPARAPSPEATQVSQSLPGIRSFEALSADLLSTFKAVDEDRASTVLTEALGLYSLEDVLLNILQPVLVEVGEAWLRREISVATEHFASAFIRNRLSNLFHASPYNPDGPLVIVACAPDEMHELGPMFLAVFLRRAGFKVVYLGQNVPLESLEGMIEVMNPQAVCLSATRAETAARLHKLREFLDELKERRGHAPLLSYGGQVFNRYPHIIERLGGVYLGEDAVNAVRRLSEQLSAAA